MVVNLESHLLWEQMPFILPNIADHVERISFMANFRWMHNVLQGTYVDVLDSVGSTFHETTT